MNRDKDWDGRPLYYDRQGQPMTMRQWAEKFEDENYTHIARDVIGPDEPLDPAPLITVSTFWRGVNHSWRHDEPLIYETLIIGEDTTRPVCATRPRSRRGKVTDGWSRSCAPAAVRVLRRRWPHQPVRTSLRPMRGTPQDVRSGQTVRLMAAIGGVRRSTSDLADQKGPLIWFQPRRAAPTKVQHPRRMRLNEVELHCCATVPPGSTVVMRWAFPDTSLRITFEW